MVQQRNLIKSWIKAVNLVMLIQQLLKQEQPEAKKQLVMTCLIWIQLVLRHSQPHWKVAQVPLKLLKRLVVPSRKLLAKQGFLQRLSKQPWKPVRLRFQLQWKLVATPKKLLLTRWKKPETQLKQF